MNYINFNGNKIAIKDIGSYNPQLDGEAYIKQFILDWFSSKSTFLFQTSGSTGKPKSIHLNRKQLEASAQGTIKAINLKQDETCLLCIHPKFIGGSMMLVRALINNMNIIYTEPSSNPLDKIDEEIDFAALVPLQAKEILETNHSKLNTIRNVIIGGGQISNDLESEISDCTNYVYSTYGMTETASHIALRGLSQPVRQDYFTALEGIEINIDDRQCLKIKGVITNNNWIQTNDIVELLESNKFIWKGRFDNIINTGGIKINAEALEKKIESIFKSQGIDVNYFITSQPNEKYGQIVTLVIESANQIKDLNIMLKEFLGKYENPKEYIYRREFVYTPTGKINKQSTLNNQ